ncbi:MAG TPA: response regulator transcription factor [Puia sp.]|nr:response regulator transcription factor [Puia sp.]
MPISLAIIEDLDEVRDGLRNFLALSTEFNVLDSFRTAEEALDAWPRCQPDIYIVDINLPGMNGIEFVRKAGGGNVGRTQFMMFTVYENDEKVFEALKAGASGYLLKNTGLVHIIEALKELYQGGSPMSSAIARKLVRSFQERGGRGQGERGQGPGERGQGPGERGQALREQADRWGEPIAGQDLPEQDAPGPECWDSALSVRENEILQLLARGLLYKEISDQLHISTSTVRQHIHRIYDKLHVQNRTEAINKTSNVREMRPKK